MTPENSAQYIIYILIGLLFAKEAFLPIFTALFKKWFGLTNDEEKRVEGIAENLVTRDGQLDERFDSIDKAVALLGSNHLHEVNDTLKRIERRLEKLDEISESLVYLKARLNGGNK